MLKGKYEGFGILYNTKNNKHYQVEFSNGLFHG
jgi:hypothetical protein